MVHKLPRLDGPESDIGQAKKFILCVTGLYILARAGEPAHFLAAPSLDFFEAALAPAPDFFPKRRRLLVFFFERLQLQGAKNTRLRPAPAPAPWQNILFPAN